jgi:hypothetical protein
MTNDNDSNDEDTTRRLDERRQLKAKIEELEHRLAEKEIENQLLKERLSEVKNTSSKPKK